MQAAHEIGKLKRALKCPSMSQIASAPYSRTYESESGAVTDRDLLCIYERIMDIMRQIQQEDVQAR